MSSNLQLVVSRQLNGVTLNCYVEPEQIDPSDFWATRTQIGELLGYADPNTAIKNIHNRNKERLDKFSRVAQIELPFGGTQEVVLYNFKGLLEICRYSQQETANAVIDVLWDIADEIRRTGSYLTKRSKQKVTPSLINSVAAVFRLAGMKDNQLALAVDKYFQSCTGHSALEVAGIELSQSQPDPEAQSNPEPRNSRAEIWEQITATFAPDEWFSASELMETLAAVPVSTRQIRRYLAEFVASKQLKRRGCLKGTEYSISKHPLCQLRA